MAPGPNGWRVNPQRQYGVFNPSERRLSGNAKRIPVWAAVVLAMAFWAALTALVAVGMHFAGGGSAMSFTELLPLHKSYVGKREIPICISCNKPTGRYQPWTSIVFRPELLDLPWVAMNATAKVQLGSGQDAGKLRIAAKGPFQFRRGAGGSKALVLRIPGLQNRNETAQPLRAVSYTTINETIIIDLPGWALGKTSQQLPVANQPGAPFKLGAPSHADVLRGQGIKA